MNASKTRSSSLVWRMKKPVPLLRRSCSPQSQAHGAWLSSSRHRQLSGLLQSEGQSRPGPSHPSRSESSPARAARVGCRGSAGRVQDEPAQAGVRTSRVRERLDPSESSSRYHFITFTPCPFAAWGGKSSNDPLDLPLDGEAYYTSWKRKKDRQKHGQLISQRTACY